MKRVARLARMDIHTNEPYYLWQNKVESVIVKKGKYKKRKVHSNNIKWFWDFDMVWEAEIYHQTAGNYSRPDPELLTDDTADISKWMEFELY